MHTTIPIVLLGAGGVGKTAFAVRHKFGEFQKKYIPTIGCDVYNVVYHTTHGAVGFEMMDLAECDDFHGNSTGFYLSARAAIAMFDLTNRGSFDAVEKWLNEFRSVNLNAPILICGNKVDLHQKKVTPAEVEEKYRDYDCYFISSNTNENFEQPLLYLAREVMKVRDLQFVPSPAVEPPEIDLTVYPV